MTLDAITFSIANADGRLVGMAAICASARYASVLLNGASRFDRRFATPAHWRQLEAEIAVGLPKSALPLSCTLARLLAGNNERQTVQWLHVVPIEVERPELAAEALDNHLRRQARELRLRFETGAAGAGRLDW